MRSEPVCLFPSLAQIDGAAASRQTDPLAGCRFAGVRGPGPCRTSRVPFRRPGELPPPKAKLALKKHIHRRAAFGRRGGVSIHTSDGYLRHSSFEGLLAGPPTILDVVAAQIGTVESRSDACIALVDLLLDEDGLLDGDGVQRRIRRRGRAFQPSRSFSGGRHRIGILAIAARSRRLLRLGRLFGAAARNQRLGAGQLVPSRVEPRHLLIRHIGRLAIQC